MKSNSPHKTFEIAFVGNPNAGKTTLFNALTGSNQKVGNYAGVTVERVFADFEIDGLPYRISDVPGLYSLEPVSIDEAVAVEVLESDVDLFVCILDGSNLERNLYLFSQLAERNRPILVVITMADRLKQQGIELDLDKLSTLLDAKICLISSHKAEDMDRLRMMIAESCAHPRCPSIAVPSAGVDTLRVRLNRIGYDISTEGLINELRQAEPGFVRYFSEFPELKQDYDQAKETVELPSVADRFAWAKAVYDRTVVQTKRIRTVSTSDKVDRVLTHRFFGLIIFLLVMYAVFFSIYTLATPFMDWIETGFSWLGDQAGALLESQPLIQSFVVDGLIAGIGGVVVFLPQILILFALISILEGTGYLARASFLMDRLLGWCGLNGRAFIPLLSSFACAIPGIMAARVMPDAKSRLATILVAPLMSCSARLPVYMLLIGAFIEPMYGPIWAGTALFGMHLLGLVVAIPVVLIFNKGILKGKRLPFVLELPPYQMPKWKHVGIALITRAKVFLTTAGTTILLMSILIWAAGYFPRLDPASSKSLPPNVAQQVQLEQSILGRFGKTIEPVFEPLGFDWRISTAIMSAFPAREVVVPSLGILFALGSEAEEKDLTEKIQEAKWPDGRPLFTPWTATGLMVFFALCAQCVSTLATVAKETGSRKWAYVMFFYMTFLAYLFAWLIQLMGRAFGSG